MGKILLNVTQCIAGTVDMGLNKENGTLATVKITIPGDAATGTYTIDLSVDGKEKNNFFYNVDGNGVIVSDSGNPLLPPVLEDLTVNVQGTEPAGAACPEHPEVTTWTDVAEGTWTGGAIAAGHYKLTGNQTPTTALTVAGDVCIDLNGYNITGPDIDNKRVFEIAAEGALTVPDTAEDAEGVISGGRVRNTQTGSPVSEVWGGNIYNEGTFNLYGGVISGGYAYTSSNYYPHISGGNIYSAEGSVINVYGGTIKDGKVYNNAPEGKEPVTAMSEGGWMFDSKTGRLITVWEPGQRTVDIMTFSELPRDE